MPSGKNVVAEAQGLYKLFNFNQPSKAEYDGKMLRITGGKVGAIRNEDIKGVKLDLRWLHHAMIVTLKNGTEIELSGFKEQAVRDLHTAVSAGVRIQQQKEAGQREASLRKQAGILEADIKTLHSKLPELLPAGQYVRKSMAVSVASRIQSVTSCCTPDLVGKLSPEARMLLSEIQDKEAFVTDEARRNEVNQKMVKDQAELLSRTAEQLGYGGLTIEQAEAIATDEDVTLVAAGAGTGKTTVILGKVAHLVVNQNIDPSRILVLVYNTNAAKEIRDRLRDEMSGVEIATFHSFGRKVIGETSEMPTVSKMADDKFRLLRTMEGFIEKMKQDDQLAQALLNLAVNMPDPYKSPFEMETQADYQQYVTNSELRTLKGEKVKSFEELTIANWLAANSIRFEYERAYEYHTASSRYRQYEPDFYLIDYGIYIEHFALDRQGKAPAGWNGYEDGVAWKREQHTKNRTKLVETYSWHNQEGILLSQLATTLDRLDVPRRKVPVQDLVKDLNERHVSRLASLLASFLNHAKSGNISLAQVESRGEASPDPKRAREFLKLWREARKQYDERLRMENAIDFHDMINSAVSIITRGGWTHNYSHVLIDEFQDISTGRMALAKALLREGMGYFLVGDDWQSIYRFTGSQVRLFNEVHEYLGFTRRVSLTQTFRFGDNIAQPSARFVQQNPDQTQRQLVGVNDHECGSLVVIADVDQRKGARTALDHIRPQRKQKDSTLILGRFWKSRENLPG